VNLIRETVCPELPNPAEGTDLADPAQRRKDSLR
jgi:hypothetical protein